MKRPCISVLILFTLAILATGTFAGVSQAAEAIEWDTDRQGQDYRNFWLSDPLPESCRRACDKEAQCRAWTFVKPGILGPQAKCWLKSGVPQKATNACCVSGVKGGAQAAGRTSARVDVDALVEPPLALTADQIAVMQKRAEGGDVRAMGVLGLYHEGRAGPADSVKRSLDEAFRWYRKAADAGDADAMLSLGLLYRTQRNDETSAARWFQKAAEKGSQLAMTSLHQAYDNGRGVRKDAAKSFDWAKKAAPNSPDGYGAYKLARKYFYGEGTRQDFVEAARWFRQAADKGYVRAMYVIGQMHCLGKGVTKDPQRGLEWLQKAAEAGSASAMYRIGEYYTHGVCTTKDLAKVTPWFEKAANAGHADAMYGLAWQYDHGYGSAASPEAAADWAVRAIRMHSQFAARLFLTAPASEWTVAFRNEFQKRLKAKGRYKGKIDGKFGPGTREAIAALSNSGAVP